MSQKSVLIVGASRGLGLGLVREYLGRGWAVTATARNLDQARELRDLAASAKPRPRLETVDIGEGAQVEALALRLRGTTYDLVFVNAGVSGPTSEAVGQVTPQQVGALFFTNAVAPIRIAETFAPYVKDDIGVIAFMSSRVGSVSEKSSGMRPLYRASKAALNSMTRSFVVRLKERPITVLSMHPGWVRTDMGGPNAPIDVPTSVAGLADAIEKHAGTKKHAFIDYQGTELAW